MWFICSDKFQMSRVDHSWLGRLTPPFFRIRQVPQLFDRPGTATIFSCWTEKNFRFKDASQSALGASFSFTEKMGRGGDTISLKALGLQVPASLSALRTDCNAMSSICPGQIPPRSQALAEGRTLNRTRQALAPQPIAVETCCEG